VLTQCYVCLELAVRCKDSGEEGIKLLDLLKQGTPLTRLCVMVVTGLAKVVTYTYPTRSIGHLTRVMLLNKITSQIDSLLAFV